MAAGIIMGVGGFVCLALATNIWLFIVAIAVFSIGEMTAHPKYYSYVGLVAPADKKAVYMGYAFLYGIIGSLVGSNLGGTLYESMLKPLVGRAGIETELRDFWLIFAGLGTVAMIGLILYNRFFANDTPTTNARARQLMIAIYGGLVIFGGWFLYTSVFGGESVLFKTMVQASIMLLIGCGGLAISMKHRQT
jgi:MFS family permease